jgi:uridine kinase
MAENFNAKINGKIYPFPNGTDLLAIHSAAVGETPCALAAELNGKLAELTQTVDKDCTIEFLYPEINEEASRIFLRGLLFLLLRAIGEAMPGERLKVDYMLVRGVCCSLKNREVTTHQIRILEEKMKEYVKENLPFTHRRISTDKAVELFGAEDQADKVQLLSFRPFDYFNMYEYDGVRNYFYGIMPPNASCLSNFTLKPFEKGFMLIFPAPYVSGNKAFEEQSKMARIFYEAENWAQILEVAKVADLNELVKNKGLREFIRVNEALHEKKLSELANSICERESARVVLIAGPSSSGKTTFANRLKIHLRVHGKQCYPISIDNYYLDREKIPLDKTGKQDLENITAIDTERFNEDILALLEGKEVVLPNFNFIKGRREDGRKLKLGEDGILIIEGIHGLNEKLSHEIPAEYKYRIFIAPFCPLNLDDQNIVFPEDIRLLRRLVRDQQTRGYSFINTLNVWESVREGEYKYILPYMENADAMFNSSLLYEAAILKKYAYDELNTLKAKSVRANYLVKFLNYFLSCDDDDEIPKNSILREFIGDSCFF